MQFKCQYGLIVKNISISSYSVYSIQFSISMPLVLFNPYIDRALSGATMLGQSGPKSNGNEGVLCIPQDPSITGTAPSDCLVSYPRHSLGRGLCILQRQPTGQSIQNKLMANE